MKTLTTECMIVFFQIEESERLCDTLGQHIEDSKSSQDLSPFPKLCSCCVKRKYKGTNTILANTDVSAVSHLEQNHISSELKSDDGCHGDRSSSKNCDIKDTKVSEQLKGNGEICDKPTKQNNLLKDSQTDLYSEENCLIIRDRNSNLYSMQSQNADLASSVGNVNKDTKSKNRCNNNTQAKSGQRKPCVSANPENKVISNILSGGATGSSKHISGGSFPTGSTGTKESRPIAQSCQKAGVSSVQIECCPLCQMVFSSV